MLTMSARIACVITSIHSVTAAVRSIATAARSRNMELIVIGDTKSPKTYGLEDCQFLSIEDQKASGFRLAKSCPINHYSRKNIGYLIAIRLGFDQILETDDDNFPCDSFFTERQQKVHAAISTNGGWVNVYKYFTDALIWPRGLPLDSINNAVIEFETLEKAEITCPIQQGLADENPDVDAVYRLILSLPQSFRDDRKLALGKGSWCPFNSQNTRWWKEAFPLLYLPSYCSFRMTDIWRSFVAQRIAWTNNWHTLFHGPTVLQKRNEHNVMADFADEIPGYLSNDCIRKTLEDLSLRPGSSNILENIRVCYRALVELEVIDKAELALLDDWLSDINNLNQ
jgi:hypothetical protein